MDKKASSSGPASSGLIWIVLFAAGAFLVHEAPWEDSRPAAAGPKAYSYASTEDIDARLWQDPLGAVVRGRDDVHARGAGDGKSADAPPPTVAERDSHSSTKLRDQIVRRQSETNVEPLVVGVMIPGGAYPETVENRRRVRYAALAGLSRQGFTPVDPEHIGYFLPDPAPPTPDGTRLTLPGFIAYEWLERVDGGGAAVLVLWIDEDVFGVKTFEHFHALDTALGLDGASAPATSGGSLAPTRANAGTAVVTHGHARFVVVGPASTPTLRDMVGTIRRTSANGLPTFYAYGATASDADIMHSVGDASPTLSVHEFLRQRGVQVVRTIGSDDALGDALKDELRKRGVDPSAFANCSNEARLRSSVQHVVLISERDTLYGRSLPETMIERFRGAGCDDDRTRAYVHQYSYLRGLDGQVSAVGTTTEGAKSSPAKPDDSPSSRSSKEKQIERPEGQSQLDYLRRLSLQLGRLDHDLHRDGNGNIVAVGVLGADVFDKLLVLQALKTRFPNVVFFTTDLDARLQHPQEQDWARNLIVASNFGLQLHPALQEDIMPFRDGYETSVFLSTQIALINATSRCASRTESSALPCIDQRTVSGWLRSPRVFEIGRNVAFEFSDDGPVTCAASLADCSGIHPPTSPRFEHITGNVFRDGVLLLGLVVLLVAFAKGFATRLRQWAIERAVVPLALFAAAVCAGFGLAIFGAPLWDGAADVLSERGAGEPISLIEGLSIWPSEAIRLVAIVASIAFLVWAWRLLDDNLVQISQDFHFHPAYEAMLDSVRDEYKQQGMRRFVRAFSFRLVEFASQTVNPYIGVSWSAQLFWKKYLYQGRLFARLCRVTAAVLVYLIVAAAVIGYFGAPNTPYRGDLSKTANQVVLIVSSGLMLFVIFFVVDATVFCHQIVKSLQDDVVRDQPYLRWADTTTSYYTGKTGLTGRPLDFWILMDFICRRTDVVAKLIYFPFIVISLMVLARSQFFDNWTMPIGLVLVLGSSVLIIAGCAVLLRETTEEARSKVLGALNDDLIRAKSVTPDAAPQIEALMARVRALTEGAFAPYSQQPIFRALLLPLSTFGGSALLDYFTLSSF